MTLASGCLEKAMWEAGAGLELGHRRGAGGHRRSPERALIFSTGAETRYQYLKAVGWLCFPENNLSAFFIS